MRLHRLSCFGFAALALGLAPACSGGQTGDLSGKGDRTDQKVGHEASNGCEEHRAEVGFQEETEAGSAEDLLSFAERSFDSPLSWKAPGEGASWTAGPESGAGALHISVTRGAKAYLLTYSEKASDGGEGPAVGLLCPPPRLGVEATVTVTTDGGALDESFETLLRSEVPGVAMLNVPFDLAELDGELTVETSSPNAKLVQLGLDAVLTPSGTTGSISGLEQVSHGSGPDGVVSARAALLATWPGGEACAAASSGGDGLDVDLADEVLGATGSSALSAVTPSAPVAVAWLDGSATTLDIGIESTGAGCFRISNSPVPGEGGPLAQYPVSVTLQSADGRLNGSYNGLVEARGSEGSRRVVASVALTVNAADVAQTGFESAALPSGTESVLLQFESTAASGAASGFVRLVAMSASPCAMQAPQSEGSGAGVPGCAGATQTRVENASWGE